MEQYQQFCQLVQSQIGIQNDANTRLQGEQAINNLKTQNPDQYISLCITVLKESKEVDIKTFCASQIKKNLTIFSPSSDNLWSKLSAQTKQQVKTQLLEVVIIEESQKLRKIICDGIGEIGATLEEDYLMAQEEGNAVHEWGDLVDTVWKMFMQDNVIILECAFLILNTLISYNPEKFDENKQQLFTLFTNGLSNENFNIKSATIACIGSYVVVIESKQIKQFEPLLQGMLEATYLMLQKGDLKGEDAMDVLEQIAESEPKFFKKNFKLLYSMVKEIFKLPDMEKTVKQQAVDISVQVIERLNNVTKGEAEVERGLCELIFYLMVENDSEITQEWKCPPEGFNDDNDDDEEDSTKFGMNCIDRFIASVGEENALNVIGLTVQDLLKHQNWRYQYAAIMALSQVGEYIDEIERVEPIIKIIVSYFSHENDKIRYAVCHSLGQIADDMKPKFQYRFSKELLPALITICKDPVPRVSSHGYAAITNFVENIDKDLIKDQLEEILKIAFHALANGISLTKENAVSCIAASADAGKEFFVPYFGEAMPILFKLYNDHSAKEYKQLRGQTLECITLIAHGVPKETFMPYFEQIVNILIQLQESQFDQVDPQKSYVLSSWQRICLVFHQEIVPYLGKIIPSLFKLVSNVFQLDTQGDDNQANTYDKDETEIAIHMLAVFITQIKQNFTPYVQQTVEIIVPLCNYEKSQQIKTSAAKCLSSILTCVKNNPELLAKLVKYFLESLYQSLLQEYDTEVMSSIATSMKECLDEIENPFYTQQELGSFADKLFQILFESDTRKAANEKHKNDEDLDDDEKEQLLEDTVAEEDLHVAIAEIIGGLFRTHKGLCIDIANKIYTSILPKVLNPELSDRIHKFGIYLISDMIQFLGSQVLQDKWQHLLEAILKYSNDKSLQVRHASVYSLGVYAEQTPPEMFKDVQQQILASLKQSLDTTNTNAQKIKEKYNMKCRDNIISSFGKIIKHQHANVQVQDLINFWIDYLPLKHDRKEALINHYLLCDILLDSPTILFSKQENYSKVLSIFGQILGTKLQSEGLTPKLYQCLLNLSKDETITNNWNNIVANLSEIQKQKLQAAIQKAQQLAQQTQKQ